MTGINVMHCCIRAQCSRGPTRKTDGILESSAYKDGKGEFVAVLWNICRNDFDVRRGYSKRNEARPLSPSPNVPCMMLLYQFVGARQPPALKYFMCLSWIWVRSRDTHKVVGHSFTLSGVHVSRGAFLSSNSHFSKAPSGESRFSKVHAQR